MRPITDAILDDLDRLAKEGSPAPWKAMIEGRDHVSGDSFIMVGQGEERGEDLYVSRHAGVATSADLDLIAAARNYLPDLIAELRRARHEP